jgi:hypothetical protein
MTRFFFSSQMKVTVLFNWGALSDERMGLPAQCFSGPRSLGLANIFYCLAFETSLFVASYDSQGHGGGIRPRLHTATTDPCYIGSTWTTQKTQRLYCCVMSLNMRKLHGHKENAVVSCDITTYAEVCLLSCCLETGCVTPLFYCCVCVFLSNGCFCGSTVLA